jgi:hypothetical protein
LDAVMRGKVTKGFKLLWPVESDFLSVGSETALQNSQMVMEYVRLDE